MNLERQRMSAVKRNMKEAIEFIDYSKKAVDYSSIKDRDKENYLAVSLSSNNMMSLKSLISEEGQKIVKPYYKRL